MKTISSFDKWLAVFFAFIGALIAFRIFYTGTVMHLFLIWNIFLAWIPYALSAYFEDAAKKPRWKQLFLFGSWLLFFPNALYIVTDLIHLDATKDIPIWFDAVLLFASSFIGIILAFVSLRRAESFLRRFFSENMVKILVPAIIFVSSFGVYLGRFERWNSWDVINNPFALAANILGNFISPIDNYKTWAITILFTGIYSMLYFFLKILPKAFEKSGLEIRD